MLSGRDVVEAEGRRRLVVTVKDLGGEVETVGPDDRMKLWIHSDLREVRRVGKGNEQRSLGLSRPELNVPDDAVVEEEPHRRPLDDEPALARRQMALEDLPVGDGDDSLVIAVSSVDVCDAVFTCVQVDHDAVER